MPHINTDYKDFDTGELVGVTAATQLPDIPCRFAFLKAPASNTGKVYIGKSDVTVPAGTTNTTAGYELSAGEEIGLPVANLNQIYRICSAAGDDLLYLVLS